MCTVSVFAFSDVTVLAPLARLPLLLWDEGVEPEDGDVWYEREGQGSAVMTSSRPSAGFWRWTPDMPAAVAAERIGWTRGMTGSWPT